MTDQTHIDHQTRRQIEPGVSRPVEPGPSRRALLAGVGAAIVAAAGGATLPALASSAAERNGTRLDRLMQEIAEILDDELMGTFTAVIGPSKEDRPLATLMPTSDVRQAIALLRKPAPFDLEAWLESQPPIERANYHQMKLAQALCEASPGKWRTAANMADERLDFLLVVRDEKTSPEEASVFVQNLTMGGVS